MSMRDTILESLRDQFKQKVRSINLVTWPTSLAIAPTGPAVDAFLLDLANNIAQGLMVDE